MSDHSNDEWFQNAVIVYFVVIPNNYYLLPILCNINTINVSISVYTSVMDFKLTYLHNSTIIK